MKEKEFIIKRLTEINNQVKGINIRYEYSEAEDAHLIEITPLSEYNSNELYINLERQLMFDFNEMFFPATILFLTEDSLIKINQAQLELSSQGFKQSEVEPFKSSRSNFSFNWSSTGLFDVEHAGDDNNYALAA
ncbi:hypothetical protein [uncultured Sunxiuqinia sp.]|uniref:hypothetical protein n=1 Tax=uncultured Sunxiuqinia sp. TaxID=1573825 RepID=UPI0026159E8C|nr:hypothetical protein [uncultured Sunxiuqinia sp.]